ncbi:hypothetical protein E2562_029649 [Oryza meyeriana var. granulata]|uniref:Uncharacterized protein n=1 Tax=Oryza meyeriana var. granulata TaxID=110450 RepID=A0A6G1FE36_9ORYZ|nr:hypothetical protein E2562_029649 [Oryza meyeriana var. granulata]
MGAGAELGRPREQRKEAGARQADAWGKERTGPMVELEESGGSVNLKRIHPGKESCTGVIGLVLVET